MKKEEEMNLVAQGFMLIKTHLICSAPALRCVILWQSECSSSVTYNTYSTWIFFHLNSVQ